MVGSQSVLVDRQRTLVERLSLGVAALGVIKRRQVVEARGHVGVLRAQRLLPDRQPPLIEGLGIGVLALGAVELRQVVEARG